jgi:pimeloyl-ACP methyl ester carboxylesterase
MTPGTASSTLDSGTTSSARRGAIVVLTAIFACSPFVIVNATYTGAKSFAAFYVVLGIAFYLAGWRKQDGVRTAAGFVAFAAGLLAHYSAAPYCVFFALHYLIAIFPKREKRWKELATIATAAGVLLAAWFGWAIANYGVQGTVMAPVNTSVTYGTQGESSYLLKYLANLFDTTVPHVLRSPSLMHTFDQPNAAGFLRDNVFVVYQTNLIFAMGILGGPLVVWFLVRALRRPETPLRNFWMALIAFTIAVGLLVVGERDYFGVAHLTLLAMFALGLTLLANRFGGSRLVATLIVAGCAIDFGLGVFLQARIEHPIDLLAPLAKAKVPILHIHGDKDKVVPLEKNSGEVAKRYKALGGTMELIVVPGKGHEEVDEFFTSERFAAFMTCQVHGCTDTPLGKASRFIRETSLRGS